MKINKILILLSTVVVLFACQDNPIATREAVRITRDNLIEPGYTWFDPNYRNYELDYAVINQIKNAFDPAHHKLLLYVKPTCACTGTQFYFPNLIKTLDSSGISTTYYEMWGLNKEDYYHPYSNLFSVVSLPAFVVLKDNVPVYSIMDTVNNIFKSYPDSTAKIEYHLLQGLLK